LKKIEKIIASLKRRYEINWDFGDPFRVLISTILSQRTKDENTELASKKLFSVYKDIRELAQAEPEEIERLIRSSGFYRVKARRIKEVAGTIMERFNGRVPDEMRELLSLPGVGRKTANCVMVYGFGRPAIPVDTHVHRIANRIGIVKTSTPHQTELSLMKTIPKRDWCSFNELLVKFGKDTCRPLQPRCGVCVIQDLCEYQKPERRC
jgi:endonuclease-3